MPKLYGYIRVSSLGQVDGTSLESQQAKIKEEYERSWKDQGFEYGGIQGDPAVSGSKPFLERPGGQKITYAAERGDVIMFCHLDRAFRSTKDALATMEMMTQLGIRPVFLDLRLDLGTPIGKFVFTNLAAFAELTRSIIRSRCHEGLLNWKKKGLVSKAWFGIKLVGEIRHKRSEVVEDDYALGLRMLSWHQKGYSYEQIANHLNDCGMRLKITKLNERPKGYQFMRVKPIERPYHWRIVARRVLGTLKTTEAIKSGRVGRRSKLPAGVAREFTVHCPMIESVLKAVAGEPTKATGPRLVCAEEIPDDEV